MNKRVIGEILKMLNLSEYVLRTDSAMVIMGIKYAVDSINISTTKEEIIRLAKEYNTEYNKLSADYFILELKIKISDNQRIIRLMSYDVPDNRIKIDGIWCQRPDYIMKVKSLIDTPSSHEDIQLLKDYII